MHCFGLSPQITKEAKKTSKDYRNAPRKMITKKVLHLNTV